MKVVAYELGTVVHLVPAEEVRPLHGIYPLTLIQKLMERYRFVNGPNLTEQWEKLSTDGLKFKFGRLINDSTEIVISELGIYNDGVVASCYTTEDAEFVLNDAVEWASVEFGLKKPISVPRLRYGSRIVVEFEKELSGLLKGFAKITNLIGASYAELYDIKYPLDLNHVSFRCDPSILPKNVVETLFSIERRLNHPFDVERFFCFAPLPTAGHVAILREIEKLA